MLKYLPARMPLYHAASVSIREKSKLDARTEAKRLTSIYAGAISGGPNQINKNIATTLAFGVLADAILIRTILVPSLISLMGHANWWMPK